jgi:hypothetical protein
LWDRGGKALRPRKMSRVYMFPPHMNLFDISRLRVCAKHCYQR